MATSISFRLFFVSVFYRKHLLGNKKRKVDTDKHGWPRVLGSPLPVRAPESQDSAPPT